jgi:hypothetical protein
MFFTAANERWSLAVQRRSGKRSVSVLAMLLAAGSAHAFNNVSGTSLSDPIRLAPYEDNFLLIGNMRHPGWTKSDDVALRARISFKYSFCGPQFRVPQIKSAAATPSPGTGKDGEVRSSTPPASTPADGPEQWRLCPDIKSEFYFAYTGEFDFYWTSRPSDPVIGRVNAPGLFLRFPASKFNPSGNWQEGDGLEIGIQHRSNGQVLEVQDPEVRRLARERYASGDFRFFDQVSRGANFLVLAVDKQLKPPSGTLSLATRARLLHYIGTQESEVNWGPLADRGRRFSDYDRLTVQSWWRISPSLAVDLSWRVGDLGFKADSWTAGLEWRVGGIPLYARAHRGPMNTLSNYTQRQDSVHLGLRFSGY